VHCYCCCCLHLTLGFGDELKGGARYSSDRGRHDDPKLHEVEGHEYEEEELELEPNYELLRHIKGEKSSLGGVGWGKKSDLRQRNSEKVNELLKDLNDPSEGQILDLDLPPTINWNDKNPRGGFAKGNADDRRRGVTEILESLERNEHEELMLEPNQPKNNSQLKWKKQSEKIDESTEQKVMKEYDSKEELILSAEHHDQNRSNTIPNWKKQLTKSSIASSSIEDNKEELILSPKVLSNSRVGPAWTKQNINRFELSEDDLETEEQLILEPQRDQKPQHGKFRQGQLSVDRYEADEKEELIISPQDPSTNRTKTVPAWKTQSTNDLRDHQIEFEQSEELILIPTQPIQKKSSSSIEWKKQNDVINIVDEQSQAAAEELILSPKKFIESNKVLSWQKQSSKFEKSPEQTSEELIIISPKHHINNTNKVSSWKKQMTSSDDLLIRQSSEELILSPYPQVKTSQALSWKNQSSNYDLSFQESNEEEEELILSPKYPPPKSRSLPWKQATNSDGPLGDGSLEQSSEELILSPHSNSQKPKQVISWEKQKEIIVPLSKQLDEELILSPHIPRRKDLVTNNDRVSRSKNVNDDGTKSQTISRKSSKEKEGIKRSKVSFESEPVTRNKLSTESKMKSQSSEKMKASSSHSKVQTITKSQGKIVDPMPTVSPPGITALTPSSTAVPYSFNSNPDKEMELLDSKLKALGL
jgi:hypothetical protein